MRIAAVEISTGYVLFSVMSPGICFFFWEKKSKNNLIEESVKRHEIRTTKK